MQPQQPTYLNYSPKKQPNFGLDQTQQAFLTPPKEHHQHGQVNHDLPTESSQIIQYMRKRPFTQYLGGIQFTYSILPKKQDKFLLTNDRFLMLKGHQSIAYGRAFTQDKELPFKTFEQVIPAKLTFLFSQIVKVEPLNNERLVIHFEKDKKKTSWEFICPSASCALEWRLKIEDALGCFRGISEKTDHPLAISIFDKEGHKFTSQINTNVSNSNISPEVNSPFKKNIQQATTPNKNKPIAVQFQGPQISKVQDFIVDPKKQLPNQQPFLGKSMSKITTDEKQDFKFQLTKIKRNWIEQLLGGQEQGELLIDFRNYIQKIAKLIIDELYLTQEQKIFPTYQQNNEYASYFLDDVYLQVYFMDKDNLNKKHPRYAIAQLEFRNMDYLLWTTQNKGVLKVPFIVLFQYKGFLGMAKSRISQNFTPKNRQCYSQMNIKQFEEVSRISSQTLLNEAKCRILSYERKTSISQTMANQKVYFVDILTELLPLEKGQAANILSKQVRPQLLQDDRFDGLVFRDKKRPIKVQKITQFIDQKENQLLRILENQEQYFTNSKELSDLLHYSCLNIRRLGSIYQKSRLFWLKKILQAELLARSLKVFYKNDIQSCIRVQTQRIITKQKQQQIQRRKVISFLNILFGVSQSTIELWKKVNNYSKSHFGAYAFQNNFTDIHIPYFLQAIQAHLRVVLVDRVYERPIFKTNNALQISDFIRFQFQHSIYNLNFTSAISQIQECLEDKSPESFDALRQILIRQTSTKVPYFQFLRNHPIHDEICQYLLDFTSPEQSRDLYNRLQENALPSRFLYESKLAEIKWYLKQNKVEQIQKPVAFIFAHGSKWLGEVHPLFVQVNRILASYFSDHPQVASRSLKYATDSLQIHKKIFGQDCQIMWKDYLLVGKAQFANKNIEQALNNLSKAKSFIKPQQLKQYQSYSELNLLLGRVYFTQKKYKEAYTTLIDLYNLIKKEKDQSSLTKAIEVVSLIRQLYEVNRQYQPFFEFLQKDFCKNLSSFASYPHLLDAAVRLLTVPVLRHTILRRTNYKARLMSLVEELCKVAHQTKSTLNNHIGIMIKNGVFPLSFLNQLKEVDSILQKITSKNLMGSWLDLFPNAKQTVLDQIGSVGREEDFLINVTALYNLYGKSMLDEIHTIDK